MKIAIDGYSSCGKSTLAKALAKELGYLFVDSGAMYRAVTLYFLEHKISIPSLQDESNKDLLNAYLDKITINFEKNSANDSFEVCLNGRNLEKKIRQIDVNSNVSTISTIKEV